MPPPTAELNSAQQAVVRAAGADADQYADQQLAMARDGLSRAQRAMSEGKQDVARALALASQSDADLAYALSREALAKNDLAQRQAEVDRLQQRIEGGRGR